MIIKLGEEIEEYTLRNKKDEDIPVYSVTNDKGFCTGYFSKDVSSKDQSTYKIVPYGCFAYNPSRINVGSVDWQHCEDKVIVSPLYVVFKVSNKINLQYLYYYLKSDIARTYIKATAAGSVRDNLKFSMLKEFPFNLRTLEEQSKIVKVLKRVENNIELCKKRAEYLDTLVKSRFIEMFGDPDTNEKGWKINTFGEICSVRQGLQIPISKRLTEYEDDCYEYITVQYLHGGKEREYIKNPKSTVICTKDDILMTRTGNTGMVVTGVDGVFHNNFFLIDFDRNKYDKDFLIQYLKLDIIQADILRRAGTSTIPDLNHGEFYKIKVFEPPIELQDRFKDFLIQTDKSKHFCEMEVAA